MSSTGQALRIGTRRSALARAQAYQVGLALQAATGAGFELVPMTTSGDRHPDRAVTAFTTKGLFVDTIRAAVGAGDCDLAVHSAKDLPVDPAPGLVIGAFPAREDPRDVLVTRAGATLATLRRLATVGTSSARRQLQLQRSRPDLQVLPLRGNIDTRLRRVAEGAFDAVVIALAGLRRLYRDPEQGGVGRLGLDLRAVALEPGECLPAPAQGALAVECRADDAGTLGMLERLDHRPTRLAVRAERAFLATVGGGCLAPVGALARLHGPELELAGMLADPVRRQLLRQTEHAPADDPEVAAERLAERMRSRGGDRILAAIAAERDRAQGPQRNRTP